MAAAYEWDEAKAASNLAKHGVSFLDAAEVFEDAGHLEVDVSRAADGEIRFKIIGTFEGRLLAVVYTLRGDTVRVISARPTNRAEEKLYGHRPVRP